ncbi:YopX family protein [Lactiplantibacillus plantarum]|uniref:YopX family protein n=1 Tax=Lactiplantibacillus plantarum TaxID=1590 RepID=UPI00203E5F4F|nr:YopX family protein [Lactiplantibacillus plantarum]MCM2585146.1 YopX family protein [Lactiplantibacillus plantarum]MCM2599071.1 YopX family protein [Lactiplantibacillus plantarum]MCM2602233.1 YopX family protein [Lactiplantibacillus plantarum]MCM2609572.1 YopX family protein [Lactiplantibacillus plantarum]MCM2611387.1 YopX family protein [Lactiplantibacillus plantarum]
MAPMIKFRGIPLEDVSSIDGVNFDGKFVYGNYAKNGDGALIIGDVLEAEEDVFWPSWWVPVEPKTVGQFTGLKDVNGKEIYIGDIVSFGSMWCVGDEYDPREEEHTGTVEYRPDYVSYVVNCNGKIYPLEELTSFDGYSVQGNVHENAELLEEDK